jgi:SsrA-binding protein
MSRNFKIVAKNRRAGFDYELLDPIEAGIVLLGSEVKSIRNGRASINESFIGTLERSEELYLFNASISRYENASYMNHEERRPRKLLLRRKQINKLLGSIKKKGMTVVPISMYFNHKGLLKLSISLAKGKTLVDKRETIKEREWNVKKHRILRNQSDT